MNHNRARLQVVLFLLLLAVGGFALAFADGDDSNALSRYLCAMVSVAALIVCGYLILTIKQPW